MKANLNLKEEAGIYKISCKDRCYIGSSKNLMERIYIHFNQLKNNKHHSSYMQRCYNKYGEDLFKVEILEIMEFDENLLREVELKYIIELNPVFNSTTPITYNHSQEMRDKIRKTLIERYKSKELINGRAGAGKRYNLYDAVGNIINFNVTSEDCVSILKLANRSMINNGIRKHGYYLSKFNEIVCLPVDKDLHFFKDQLINLKSKKAVSLFKIDLNNNTTAKCSACVKLKIIKKIENSDNFIYYSKKEKAYYCFIGLFAICRPK